MGFQNQMRLGFASPPGREIEGRSRKQGSCMFGSVYMGNRTNICGPENCPGDRSICEYQCKTVIPYLR